MNLFNWLDNKFSKRRNDILWAFLVESILFDMRKIFHFWGLKNLQAIKVKHKRVEFLLFFPGIIFLMVDTEYEISSVDKIFFV